MTHEDAIDVLLEVVAGQKGRAETRGLTREQAESHVTECSECWAFLQLIHEKVVGVESSAQGWSGKNCEHVRERLYLLTGIPPDQARAQYPDIVVHLRWCADCRSRAATLLRIESEMERGAYELAEPSRHQALWRETVTRPTERVYEMARDLVVHVRGRAAAFTDLPVGLSAVAHGSPPSPQRGAPPDATAVVGRPGQRVAVALGDSGLTVRLSVEPEGAGRARLTLEIEGRGGRRIAMSVRKGSSLLAAQSTEAPVAPVILELAAGDYVVDVWESEPQRRFRVRLNLNASASP